MPDFLYGSSRRTSKRELVSVIITLHGRWHEAGRACVESVLRHTREPRRIIVMDNGSPVAIPSVDHEDLLWLRVSDQRTIGGLTGSWNLGIAVSLSLGCDRFVLLNHDTEVDCTWSNFIDAIAPHPLAVYGPVTDNPGHQPLQAVSSCWAETGIESVEFVNGFCLGLHRNVIARVLDARGYVFDPDLPFGGNEDEFCEFIRGLGGSSRVVRQSFVRHKKLADWRRLFDERA